MPSSYLRRGRGSKAALILHSAGYVPDVVVEFLPTLLIDWGTDRPDDTVLEPKFHHLGIVVLVIRIHLRI